jgi:hypothetical protein
MDPIMPSPSTQNQKTQQQEHGLTKASSSAAISGENELGLQGISMIPSHLNIFRSDHQLNHNHDND